MSHTRLIKASDLEIKIFVVNQNNAVWNKVMKRSVTKHEKCFSRKHIVSKRNVYRIPSLFVGNTFQKYLIENRKTVKSKSNITAKARG
jgi:hypothetical protein